MYGKDPDKVLIMYGTLDYIPRKFDTQFMSSSEESEIFLQISNIDIQENFDMNADHDDIAIVTVKDHFDFDDDLAEKIGLQPDISVPKPGEFCKIAGFGATNPRASKESHFSNYLRTGQVPIMNWRTCRKRYKKYFHEQNLTFDRNNGVVELYNDNLCAGPGKPDACLVSITTTYSFFYHNVLKVKTGQVSIFKIVFLYYTACQKFLR